VTTTLPLIALLESHDPRIQVEYVAPWVPPRICDLCTYLECAGDSLVSWHSAVDKGDHSAYINRSHLDGWITGFLLADLGDPDAWPDPVLVWIGGTP
jgi:hypothetical protein